MHVQRPLWANHEEPHISRGCEARMVVVVPQATLITKAALRTHLDALNGSGRAVRATIQGDTMYR